MKTAQGNDRDPFDQYFTPLPFAQAHVRHLIEVGYLKNGMVVVDAGCGDGSYLRALEIEAKIQSFDVVLIGVELDARIPTACSMSTRVEHRSFLEWDGKADLFVGNPPFTVAEAFVWKALQTAPVSFLLQSQFVSGKKKHKSGIWNALERVDPFTSRPKFYGPAMDAINERRKAEGKKPAGGNAVDYSAITWSPWRPKEQKDFKGRHIVPLALDDDSE
jgi:hypothetical protein